MAQTDETTPGHALRGGSPGASDDPQVVRAEIEQTRERMSETIDEIEEALARKKERIQERLDVLAPVRQRPLQSAGIAFGVGLLLGVVTGGGDSGDRDDEQERVRESHGRYPAMSIAGMGLSRGHHDEENWEERARMWESRARRLLNVAREQEEAIREMQERYGTLYSHDLEHHHGFSREDEETVGALRSTVTGLRDSVLGGLTELLTDAFHQMGREKGARTA